MKEKLGQELLVQEAGAVANKNSLGYGRPNTPLSPARVRYRRPLLKGIEAVAHRLNHGLRKCRGYRTPHDVITSQSLDEDPAAPKLSVVALQLGCATQ